MGYEFQTDLLFLIPGVGFEKRPHSMSIYTVGHIIRLFGGMPVGGIKIGCLIRTGWRTIDCQIHLLSVQCGKDSSWKFPRTNWIGELFW